MCGHDEHEVDIARREAKVGDPLDSPSWRRFRRLPYISALIAVLSLLIAAVVGMDTISGVEIVLLILISFYWLVYGGMRRLEYRFLSFFCGRILGFSEEAVLRLALCADPYLAVTCSAILLGVAVTFWLPPLVTN